MKKSKRTKPNPLARILPTSQAAQLVILLVICLAFTAGYALKAGTQERASAKQFVQKYQAINQAQFRSHR